MFDILNSHSPYGRGWKGPARPGNLQYLKDTITETMNYLQSLKLPNGQYVKDCRRSTFIIGFEVGVMVIVFILHSHYFLFSSYQIMMQSFQTAARSFIRIRETLFASHPEVKYILGYKLGQDHIETLFSKIRTKGGCNNNPDVIQFSAALKGLLVKTDITPSSNANCLELADDTPTPILRGKKPGKNDDEGDADTIMEPGSVARAVELDMTTLSEPIEDVVEHIGREQ